jgi:hypothetical protein
MALEQLGNLRQLWAATEDAVTPDAAFQHAHDLLTTALTAVPDLITPFISPMPYGIDLCWRNVEANHKPRYFMVHVETDGSLRLSGSEEVLSVAQVCQELKARHMHFVPFGLL